MPDSVIAEDFEQARFNMIEQQIRPWDVLDQRVLDVIAELPREDFVPQRYRSTLAFSDISIPIGHEQYMLAPKLQARILQSLGIRTGERVLEVGCGNGYLTACLAKLGGETVGVDIFQDFVDQTQGRLDKLGLDHARCQLRDAARGWDEKDRFDAIAVTGSLPKKHEGFHTCLSIGGRLFLVTGTPPVMEALLITRVSEDQWAEESLFDTSIPPLLHAPPADRFRF